MEDGHDPEERTDRPPRSLFGPIDVEILDRLGDPILITDEEGRFVHANPAATTMLGYPRSELLAMSIGDVTARPVERIEAELTRFAADGSWRGEVELRRRDGTTVTVDFRASFLKQGRARYAVNIFHDITSQKQAELASQRRAERMSQLFAITAELSAIAEAAAIGDALAQMIVSAFGADRGGVVLRAEDGALETIAHRGFAPELIARWTRFDLDERTPVGKAILSNEPVVMPDRETGSIATKVLRSSRSPPPPP